MKKKKKDPKPPEPKPADTRNVGTVIVEELQKISRRVSRIDKRTRPRKLGKRGEEGTSFLDRPLFGHTPEEEE